MDTAYGSSLIRRIRNWSNALSCEVLALIRRISFVGYGSVETALRVSIDDVRIFEMTASEIWYTAQGVVKLLVEVITTTASSFGAAAWGIPYTQIDINYAAGGNLWRLSAEEAWKTIEDCAQCDKQ
ncbi:hypothetical protein Tco_0678488 [Tanacetum coccineum]|uniref:Uncharacterized protein n=1 Tax=Tanacetum coccineum TaxID=301880 RepID=A0ABQ4XF83_9ASTR